MIEPILSDRFHDNLGLLNNRSGKSRDIALLMLLCALILIPGLGARDPWPADEPRFALAAQQMVDSGQWFFPGRGHELYPDKPPVFMWMIAFFYFIFGNIKFVFLIPSALAATATVMLVYDLGYRLWGRKEGLASAVSLLAMAQFMIQAKSAQIDMVLTFWTTLGLYGLIRHLVLEKSRFWFLLGSFAMGLGIITKGVGFLPAFVFIPYAFARWKKWRPLNEHASVSFLGLSPVFLLLGVLLWFGPMLYLVHSSGDASFLAYRNDILFKQTADRYLKSWHHIRPFYYYILQVFPWAWLPFSLLIIPLTRIWHSKLKEKDSRYLILLGWCLLTLLFFSITKGKRGVYILPITPVFALLAGSVQSHFLNRSSVQTYLRILTTCFGTIFLIAGLYLTIVPTAVAAKTGFVPELRLTLSMIFIGMIIIAIAWAKRSRNNAAPLVFLTSWFLMWAFISTMIWPAMNSVRSPGQMMHEIRQTMGDNSILGMVSWKEQLLLQADGPVETFGFKKSHEDQMKEALNWLNNTHASHHWLLINGNEDITPFKEDDAVYIRIMHSRKWMLFQKKSEKHPLK